MYYDSGILKEIYLSSLLDRYKHVRSSNDCSPVRERKKSGKGKNFEWTMEFDTVKIDAIARRWHGCFIRF